MDIANIRESWLDTQVSYYRNHTDKNGEPATLRSILHDRYEDHLALLLVLQSLDPSAENYYAEKRKLKAVLPCYALNHLRQRKEVLAYSGLMCLDFDHVNDIEATKKIISEFPFVAYCSKSCSGSGLFAFIRIADPQQQEKYFRHLQVVLNCFKLPIDPTKGKNYNDLRYISWDHAPHCNENPIPLNPVKFYSPEPRRTTTPAPNYSGDKSKLVEWAVNKIAETQIGSRFETVRKIAYGLGGYGIGLGEIINAISNSSHFKGEANQFVRLAEKCFQAGSKKPLNNGRKIIYRRNAAT